MIRHASRRFASHDLRSGSGSLLRLPRPSLKTLAHLFIFLCAAVSTPAFADEDETIDLLARTIYHEAGGEGVQGMIAVGWVVLNRTRDPSFPRAIVDVIRQRYKGSCQWSWACGEPRTPRGANWRMAQAVAVRMLTEPPPDPTNGAVWLQNARAREPQWGIRVFKTARIGNHAFYGRRPSADNLAWAISR